MTVLIRRCLAAAVAIQPLLVGVNALFHPDVDISAASLLAGAATGPTRWFVVHVIAATGALLGVGAVLGLRTLVTFRGRNLATAGVVVGLVGSALLSMAFAAEASVLRLAAVLDPGAGLAVAEAYVSTPEFYVVPVGVLLSTVGTLLLAAALLVAGGVPRWQPVALLIGGLGSLAAVPGTLLGPIAFAIVFVASVGLARRIMRQGDARTADVATAAPVPA